MRCFIYARCPSDRQREASIEHQVRRCRSRAEALHQELPAGNTPEALEAARALIDRVIIHPAEDDGGPPGVARVGEILAMPGAGGVDLLGETDAQSKGALPLFARPVKQGMGDPSLPRSRRCR